MESYVSYLPPGSAVWCIENGVEFGTTPSDLIQADIFYALTGEAHPLRPKPRKDTGHAQKRHEMLAAQLLAQRERVNAQKGGAA